MAFAYPVDADGWWGVAVSPEADRGSRRSLGPAIGFGEQDGWSVRIDGTPWARAGLLRSSVSTFHLILLRLDAGFAV